MIQGEHNTINTSETSIETQTMTSTKSDQSNSLSDSANALKNLNFRTLYVLNSYVDALDSYSTWRIGKILELNGDYAKLNFDGWSHKWDEVILKLNPLIDRILNSHLTKLHLLERSLLPILEEIKEPSEISSSNSPKTIF
jgi:hypothetical protein